MKDEREGISARMLTVKTEVREGKHKGRQATRLETHEQRGQEVGIRGEKEDTERERQHCPPMKRLNFE